VVLTRTFSEEFYERVLEDWAWLPLEGKRPFLASLFGDIFLEDNAGIWMLDVLEGSLERVFADRSQMAAVLETEEGQDRYLLSGLAFGAEHRLGIVPGPAQVLAWRLPPVLGAPTKVENLQLMDFEVYLSLQGQLHRQLKDLPPGAKITGFTVGGEAPQPLRDQAGRGSL
jgi:hypothetical protein